MEESSLSSHDDGHSNGPTRNAPPQSGMRSTDVLRHLAAQRARWGSVLWGTASISTGAVQLMSGLPDKSSAVCRVDAWQVFLENFVSSALTPMRLQLKDRQYLCQYLAAVAESTREVRQERCLSFPKELCVTLNTRAQDLRPVLLQCSRLMSTAVWVKESLQSLREIQSVQPSCRGQLPRLACSYQRPLASSMLASWERRTLDIGLLLHQCPEPWFEDLVMCTPCFMTQGASQRDYMGPFVVQIVLRNTFGGGSVLDVTPDFVRPLEEEWLIPVHLILLKAGPRDVSPTRVIVDPWTHHPTPVRAETTQVRQMFERGWFMMTWNEEIESDADGEEEMTEAALRSMLQI